MSTGRAGRHTPRHAAQRGRAKAAEPGQRAAKRAPHSVTREIVEWVVVLALAVALAYSVNTWVGGLVTVEGRSMEPTLYNAEKVLVGKVEYYFSKPERGEIVIIKYPDRADDIIKRVIATAGERVAVTGGSVYVDGRKLDEPYLADTIWMETPEQTVPEGTIFVMGDNRNDSHDSRAADVGPIPLNQVLGKAYWVVWPLGRFSKLTDYAGINAK